MRVISIKNGHNTGSSTLKVRDNCIRQFFYLSPDQPDGSVVVLREKP